ncbi:hypothetical protein [Azohydromonas lata]|uniref:Uncharacterized protein n=1 Tax=Azohydromonas lata TaxID=45677 RepID=A0ABU5IS66_9BURK|nr:hypothetical protein [Azohydromonas lata]MDZ5461744.1 hypothetical protein [Azohydromonas lata]
MRPPLRPSSAVLPVRRLIAIVLMLLLPLQSAWALVAMPCLGHLSLPLAVQAAQAEAQGHGAAHHAAHAGHDVAPAALAHQAGAAAHQHRDGHDGHDAAATGPADDGGTSSSPLSDPCSGSAACMSLHSPPLSAAFDAGLPALAPAGWLPPAPGQRFSSVPPQRLHRPPIGLAA